MPRKYQRKNPKGLKRGRLSAKEIIYCEKFRDRLTPEQMAARLNRPLTTVARYLDGSQDRTPKAELTLAAELETRPEWRQWQEQFTPQELEFFKYRYVQLMAQFRDDIMPTEEIQVFQFITLDILTQRVMREQKKLIQEMDYTQALLEDLYDAIRRKKLPDDDPELQADHKKVRFYEGKYAELSAALKPISQRHEAYMMRQSNMLKELKGTRDQRIKILEGSKQSFLGFLRALQEDDFRIEQGDLMEKHARAVEKEAAKLAAPHTYIDGTIDQPLLTPDTVLGDGDGDEEDADATLEAEYAG